MIRVREERASDSTAIEAVIVAAFRSATHASHTEQFIVRALRDSGQLAVSLVAEESGGVIGHVAVSPVAISSGAQGFYGLGPVSVVPMHQGQGVGSLLVEHALAQLRMIGANGCVVLGDPGYYARFGFNTDPALVLEGVPPEYFQGIAFVGALPSGQVKYHDSFEATA